MQLSRMTILDILEVPKYNGPKSDQKRNLFHQTISLILLPTIQRALGTSLTTLLPRPVGFLIGGLPSSAFQTWLLFLRNLQD